MQTSEPTNIQTSGQRLLVFNCHEAWVYQLTVVDYDLDIIVGLKGHHVSAWDHHSRPVPPRARLLSLEQARQTSEKYACIITHNPTDLLDIKHRTEPRLLIIHLPIEARQVEEKAHVSAEQMKQQIHKYVALMGVHVVAVSSLKGQSWDFIDDIIPFGMDPDAYLPYQGRLACGLRIANYIDGRKSFLLWDFHQQTFKGLPVRIVGHNPDMPNVQASRHWHHLKQLLASHRFYIHTAHEKLEDGYNMATIEAMAAGLPVLGNQHPTSPIIHGKNGFLSNNPLELRKYALRLLLDRDLAGHMGQEARCTVREKFDIQQFKISMEKAIQKAVLKRQHAPVMDSVSINSSSMTDKTLPINTIDAPSDSSQPGHNKALIP